MPTFYLFFAGRELGTYTYPSFYQGEGSGNNPLSVVMA